jgi:hypothetical protein
MSDEESSVPSTGKVDENELVPVSRDTRFLLRLVLLALLGVIAAAFVGAKLKGFAGTCGAGLIRPGTSVIPAAH